MVRHDQAGLQPKKAGLSMDYSKKYEGMREIISKCSDGDRLSDEELARYKDFMDADARHRAGRTDDR